MIALVTVIRLRASGKMARFSEDGRLIEWVTQASRATHFRDELAATVAIRGICAPEIRALIRSGYALRVVDEATDEIHVVDAERLLPVASARIRPDVGPRFLGDDPARGVGTVNAARRAAWAARLVGVLFAEAPRLNWRLQTKPRISPSSMPNDEYTTPVSARARHAGALARFSLKKRQPAAQVAA